jgi:hypothetical protein
MRSTIRQMSVLFAVAFALSVTSCVGAPPVPYQYSVSSDKNSDLLAFDVQWGWNKVFGGFSGFTVTFKSKTDKVVRIVWEKSSLSYAGQSYPPFIEGQKYSEATRPMAPTIVPGNGAVTKSVFSSQQPRYVEGQYGGWTMDPIPAKDVSLIFCVQSGDIEDYLTVVVKPVAE